jgi:hypothetical protein
VNKEIMMNVRSRNSEETGVKISMSCSGITIALDSRMQECDDHFNNLSPSDNKEDGPKSLFDEEEISNVSTMTSVPQTPQIQSSVELNNTISDLLRLLLTQEVTGTDRLLLITRN